MLKKAGAIAAAAAGLLMLGAPAFAGENPTYNGQIGLVNLNDINVLDDINANAVAGVCNNNVGGLLGLVVPVLSPEYVESCAGGGITD
ncbi:MAG: hypothetical protein ABW224_04865 [Kibdelosporangium sp.]